MTARPLRLVILLSGRGSNMAALVRACAVPGYGVVPVGVLSDRPDAGGLALARDLSVVTRVVAARDYRMRDDFDAALARTIDALEPDLVALAGFMRILGSAFVARYRGRLLNVHPSLLPHYKGLHTHRRVLEAGDTEHGCSVHYVTEELDGGPVVLQGRLRIRAGEDATALSARVQRCEHILYPRVVGWIASGRLRYGPTGPELDGRHLAAPIQEVCDVEPA
jgi:phosphoribosylglycinamide formyltransferase-1